MASGFEHLAVRSVGAAVGSLVLIWAAPALADPAQQLAAAMREVRLVQGTSEMDVIRQHLRYAENCVVGRDSGYYYAPEDDTGPCTDRQSVRDQVPDPGAKQRLRSLENMLGSARMQGTALASHDAAEDAGTLIGQILSSLRGGGGQPSAMARPAGPAQAYANARAAAAARAASTPAPASYPARAMPAAAPAARPGVPSEALVRSLIVARYEPGGNTRDSHLDVASVQIGPAVRANPGQARDWEVNLNQTVFPVHTRYSLVNRTGVASSIRDWDTHYVVYISPITGHWDISSASAATDIDGVLRGAGPAG